MLWHQPTSGKQSNRLAHPLVVQVVVADYQGPTGARGLFNGTGVATFKSGNTYKGQFEHGRMNGQGNYTWMDGLQYIGGFVRNHITGSGVSANSLHVTPRQSLLVATCTKCSLFPGVYMA